MLVFMFIKVVEEGVVLGIARVGVVTLTCSG